MKRVKIGAATLPGFTNSIPFAPEEIISNLNDYPLQAATAAYAFSLVEVYGNDVANLFKPRSVRPLGSWHADIKFDLDSRDTAQSLRAAAAFAKLFDGDPADIKPASVRGRPLTRSGEARPHTTDRKWRTAQRSGCKPYG